MLAHNRNNAAYRAYNAFYFLIAWVLTKKKKRNGVIKSYFFKTIALNS